MPVHACVGCVIQNSNHINISYTVPNYVCSDRCGISYAAANLHTPPTTRRLPMEPERVLPFVYPPSPEDGCRRWTPIWVTEQEGTRSNPIVII